MDKLLAIKWKKFFILNQAIEKPIVEKPVIVEPPVVINFEASKQDLEKL